MMRLSVQSKKKQETIEVTDQVQEAVFQSGVQNGLVQLFVPHTTAAVTINENADPDVVHDLLLAIAELVPEDPAFRHAEGNSAAQLKSSLFGAGELTPLEDGKLVLGTWQGIYFCEFDGPRSRKLLANILSA